MAGLNRAFLKDNSILENYKILSKSNDIECVFISHQKADKEICQKIADYLMMAGIDVYFDEYEYDLKIANQVQDPKAVTKAILKGIHNSSHMLCVISLNTLDSKWVPFEVGYGYDKTKLGILLLKGIKKEQLPDYIKAVDLVIPDIYDLNSFLSRLTKTGKLVLENKSLIRNWNEERHPLTNYMENFLMI